ncbi:lipocalin-like domain-containing protein [Rhizobium sp. LEGMi198b]|uniref:lipocalin-like domain-containing protein n=1 Tax=unclassified Rhizobium TaxID=2613769 RepID=UPI0021A58676|nr:MULTISPECIES: lipocalin-like domain-containing protein [Rhizobium]MDK4740390.1 lipocalin-like domain-containing protein [Rhizobium sp. CNPSo 3464]UWU24594.1 lipocalin-like domain-containing protein [Rhizobium tropici]WFU05571.1 lipocalin-like domain-containing protein [Rhizobium sp. CB3171]
MNSLKGSWKLSGWRRTTSKGDVSYPLGEEASGLLVYTSSGTMMVQMTAANRPAFETSDPLGGSAEERAAAYSTCLAYFGSYRVAEGKVTHRIEGSSFPNWSETEQVRPYELKGDELILRTPPSESGGITTVNEMSWIRVKGPADA